jgi:all-trans-retinol dehydrogenase (NAD+)
MGSRVVAWDRDANALASLEEESKAEGLAIFAFECDVTDRARVYALAERVERDVGPVDILVNNAGIVSGKPLLETPDDRIVRTIEVNFLSNCWTVKASCLQCLSGTRDTS